MVAKKKSISRLLLVLIIFAAGYGLVINSASPNSKTKFSASVTTNTDMQEGVQSSTPTYQSIVTPLATRTHSPTATIIPTSTTVIPTPINPKILGFSTDGYPIEIYRYGNGPVTVVFIGGIHGGYEWNTILLAYELIDYFDKNPDVLQPRLTIYIVPSANPDGQVRVVGHAGRFLAQEVKDNTFDGRFNGNGVDLNRNWDCDWSPDAVWRDTKLDPGKQPFSEIETRLLRDFIVTQSPAGVVFWHSAYPAVFSGGCNENHQPSRSLSEVYALSAEYPSLDAFTSYKVTGNSSNWLALQNIPAIEVELTNHVETDFDRNLKGVLGVFEYIANSPPVTMPSTQQSP